MKVALANKYGPPSVLRIVDIPKPVINDKQILVKIKAVAVTAADLRIRSAQFPRGFGLLARLAFGITKPRQPILGSVFSGVVESVGNNVTDYKPGDEVCGMTGIKMGAYAEFIAIDPTKSTAIKPKGISHIDAAGMLFGGTAALFFLRDRLAVHPGDTALINGGSGAVGTNAVQLANFFGAQVTAVAKNSNLALMKDIGAHQAIDYMKQNIFTTGTTFDVVLDTVGNVSPETAKTLLTNKGRAGLMVGSLGEMLRMHGRIKGGTATEKKADIAFLLSLMETGTLKAVIDKTFNFSDIVAAHDHAERHRKAGIVVLIMN